MRTLPAPPLVECGDSASGVPSELSKSATVPFLEEPSKGERDQSLEVSDALQLTGQGSALGFSSAETVSFSGLMHVERTVFRFKGSALMAGDARRNSIIYTRGLISYAPAVGMHWQGPDMLPSPTSTELSQTMPKMCRGVETCHAPYAPGFEEAEIRQLTRPYMPRAPQKRPIVSCLLS